MQLLPAFVFGLYTNARAVAMESGLLGGGITVIVAFLLYQLGLYPIQKWLPVEILGILVNFAIVVLVWALMHKAEPRAPPLGRLVEFGEPLTLLRIEEYMNGTMEPCCVLKLVMLAIGLCAITGFKGNAL